MLARGSVITCSLPPAPALSLTFAHPSLTPFSLFISFSCYLYKEFFFFGDLRLLFVVTLNSRSSSNTCHVIMIYVILFSLTSSCRSSRLLFTFNLYKMYILMYYDLIDEMLNYPPSSPYGISSWKRQSGPRLLLLSSLLSILGIDHCLSYVG